MKLVRRAALITMVAGATTLFGCTAILGDFDVGGAGDDASTPDATGNDGPITMADGAADVITTADSAPDSVASTARLIIDHTAYDFGTHTVGSTVPGGTLTITNTGSGASAALTVQINAGPAFRITGGTCVGTGVTLGSMQACTVLFTVDSTNAGSPTGTLVVSEGASDSVQSRLAASIVTPGALSLTPGDQDMGNVVTGGTGMDFVFTGKNTGGVTTGTITTALSGTNMSDFIITADTCNGATLASMMTCSITAHVVPGGTGMRTASLAISATPGGTATANLHGNGLAPAAITFAPISSNDYLTHDVGSTTAAFTFTLKNTGGVPAAIAATGISGSNGTEFIVNPDNCSGQMVAANGTCTIGVAFSPQSRGPKSATLTANATGIGMATATLAATGRDYETLTVAKNGTGGGTVTGDLIACGSTCAEQVARTSLTDPVIVLTASPDGTSTFTGWSGAGCSGTGTCAVTMSAAQAVTATFTRIQYTLGFSVSFVGPASGSVVSSPGGISCNGQCNNPFPFDAGTMVTLTATVPAGYLYRWTGACAGTGPTCTVTMSQAQTETLIVTAYNYMFITSTGSTGNIGGLAGADAKCQTLASAQSLPGTYVAYLATSTTNAISRLGSANGWVRVDGRPFADTTASMKQSKIYFPPNVNEKGLSQNSITWTGTAGEDGSVQAGGTCTDWTAATGSGQGGQSTGGSAAWATNSGVGCASPVPFYCFGTDLNRAMSFTAAPGRRAFISTANFDTTTGLVGADTLCRNEAAAASLPNSANFVAFLSTTTVPATTRVNMGGNPWVRTDGIPIVAAATDISTSTLIAPIAVHADGTTYIHNGQNVRSGSGMQTVVGTAQQTCNSWTTASGGGVERGWPSIAGPWFFGFTADQNCGTSLPIYCFEQ